MNGLYEIVHQPTGRAYIGSSVDVARRLRAHRAMLRRGVHDNVWLQRTWARDGAQSFILRPLEECAQPRLRQREAEVIAARRPNVFNLSEVVRRGARAGNSSITDDEVREIYRRAAQGAAVTDLAKEFGHSKENVRRIVFGRTYTHVTGGNPARPPKKASAGRNTNSKLDAAAVKAIRARIHQGESVAGLAREYGVTNRAVVCVRDRLTWKHVA